MKTLLCFVLALGCAAYGDVAVAQAQKHVSDSGSTAKAPQADQRGTPASPLVVNARAIQSDAEAAEESRKDAEQHSANRWSIWLTFAIAICAFLQFCAIVGQIVVYRGQSRMMLVGIRLGRKNAQAALTAANAAITQINLMKGKERAILRFKLEDFERTPNPILGYIVKANVSIFGVTEALIESSEFLAALIEPEEYETENPWLPSMALPDVISPRDAPIGVSADLHRGPSLLVGDEGIADVLEGQSFIRCKGKIAYRDRFGDKWELRFFRRWQYLRLPGGMPPFGFWSNYGKPEDNGEYPAN